jgi:hypothetical protein
MTMERHVPPGKSRGRDTQRNEPLGDGTLAADERPAGQRLESDLKRYHAAPAKGARKKAEGDIAKDALTKGDQLKKGRPAGR